MIVKSSGKYIVKSKRTGRSFGTYKTEREAKRRLRQIEYFRHLEK